MKRKKWSVEEKKLIVLELLKGTKPAVQLCKEYGISDSLLYTWREKALKSLDYAFSERKSCENGTAERERLLKIIGEQACVIDTLKKISNQI